MGLLDRIKSFGSSVVDTAKKAESAVENTVSSVAETATHAVSDGFDAAKKAAVDLGTRAADVASVIPNKVAGGAAQVAHLWYDDLNKAADTFGGAMQGAGALMEKGGKALGPYVPFASDAVVLGQAAQVLGKGVADAPEAAVAGATSVLHTAQDLEHKGEQFLDRARQLVGEGVDAAKHGLQLVGQGVDAAKNAVTGFVSEVARATDYGHNIDELGKGDKYKLAVGGSVSVEGGKGYAKGAVEVTRNEAGKYVVSVDGELGGGIYGEVGGKLGAKLDAEGSVTLGVGGKMEMTFDSAEEAKKATGIILKQAAASAVGAEANQLAPVVGGLVAQKAIGPSADEMKFLADHTSAVELRGNAAAEVAGCVGVKDVAGLFGGAAVKEEVAARIEFKNDEGEPKTPELVLKQTVTGEATLGAGLKVSDGNKESPTGGSATYAGGKGEAKVAVEQRFTLPNVSSTDLLSNPLKAISGAASSMQKSEKDKITLGLDLSGQAFGNGGGVEATASYSGNFAELSAAAIDRLRQGDVAGALKTVNAGEAEVKVEPYTTLGISYSPSISIMGFGVGASFEATRKDVSEEHTFDKKGTPAEVARDLNARLQPYLPYLRAGLPPQLRG